MRDDKPAEVNFNLQSLAGIEAAVLEPTARELEPRHEWWGVAMSAGLESRERLLGKR